MVKVSTVCTLAEAAAGGTPAEMSKVLEMVPKAMPTAPSTSCAAKPMARKGRISPQSRASQSGNASLRSSRPGGGGGPR